MTTLFFILVAILLLGILITIHELGHFVAARITKIPVQEFAIGFGPKFFGWKSKKYETVFSLRAIPLGGYCAFYGEDDPNEGAKLQHPEWNINLFPVWRRFIVILMGPIMNFVLAFIVAFAFFFIGGAATPVYDGIIITGVNNNSPAQEAGLQPGDQILSVNHLPVAPDMNPSLLQSLIGQNRDLSEPAIIEVSRNQQSQTLSIMPTYDEAAKTYLLGITISQKVLPGEKVPLSFTQSLQTSWDNCLYAGKLIITSLGNMVKTGEGIDQMTGPIGTIDIISKQTRETGFDGFINLLIVISINLGLFNLLPIPGLDGSRLLFLLVEKVLSWFHVKMNRNAEAIINLAGFFLLIGVAIFFTYKDIVRIFIR